MIPMHAALYAAMLVVVMMPALTIAMMAHLLAAVMVAAQGNQF